MSIWMNSEPICPSSKSTAKDLMSTIWIGLTVGEKLKPSPFSFMKLLFEKKLLILSVLVILFPIIFLRRTLKKEKVFSFIKISTIDYTCTFKGTKIKIHDLKKT